MLFYLVKLKRNLRLKPYELRSLQLMKFRALVRHAYENVAFYHKKFREAGVKPDDIKSFDDFYRIPVTTKFEIQACNPKDVINRNVDVSSLIKKTTSGSTGVPLTIFVDSRVEDFHTAVWMRALFEDGLKFRDRMVFIADPRSFPKRKSLFQHFDIIERKYISIFYSADKQIALLKEFKPDVIKGYASSLFILAKEFRDMIREIRPRIVFSGAEVLDAASRRLISSAFGGELFDLYGCHEFNLLAWECKAHNGYHVNADSVLMEFLDNDGEAVASGEMGKVVCTGLFNYVMPLIRYELGDVAVPLNDECTCGVTLPLIKSYEGRADDFLLASDGRVISPTVFFPYPFEDVDWIRQFRVIQESRKKLVIQVAAKETLANQDKIVRNAESKIRMLFGEDMEVEFEFVEEIPRDPSGKLRKVISHVNRTAERI
jgi:phenylacetate-CoA ligase